MNLRLIAQHTKALTEILANLQVWPPTLAFHVWLLVLWMNPDKQKQVQLAEAQRSVSVSGDVRCKP